METNIQTRVAYCIVKISALKMKISLLLFIIHYALHNAEETDDFNKVQQLFQADPEPKVDISWLLRRGMCEKGAEVFGEHRMKLYARGLTNENDTHDIMVHYVRFEYRPDDASKFTKERYLRSRNNAERKGKMKISDRENDTHKSNFGDFPKNHDIGKRKAKEIKRNVLMGVTECYVAVCPEINGSNYFGISFASPEPNRGKCYYILTPAMNVIQSEKQYITIEEWEIDENGRSYKTYPIIEAPQFIPKAKKCLDPRDNEKPTKRRNERSPTKIKKIPWNECSSSYQYEDMETFMTRVSVENFMEHMRPLPNAKSAASEKRDDIKFEKTNVKPLPETNSKKIGKPQVLEPNDSRVNTNYSPSKTYSSTNTALKANVLPSNEGPSSKDDNYYLSKNKSEKGSCSKASSSKELPSKELNLKESNSEKPSSKELNLKESNSEKPSSKELCSEKSSSQDVYRRKSSSKRVSSRTTTKMRIRDEDRYRLIKSLVANILLWGFLYIIWALCT